MNPGISVIARRINSGHFSCYLICKSVFGALKYRSLYAGGMFWTDSLSCLMHWLASFVDTLFPVAFL